MAKAAQTDEITWTVEDLWTLPDDGNLYSVAQDAVLRIQRGWAGAQDNILRHIFRFSREDLT